MSKQAGSELLLLERADSQKTTERKGGTYPNQNQTKIDHPLPLKMDPAAINHEVISAESGTSDTNKQVAVISPVRPPKAMKIMLELTRLDTVSFAQTAETTQVEEVQTSGKVQQIPTIEWVSRKTKEMVEKAVVDGQACDSCNSRQVENLHPCKRAVLYAFLPMRLSALKQRSGGRPPEDHQIARTWQGQV